MTQDKEKFDSVIEKLINKKISCEDLLSHLNNNRLKFYNDTRSSEVLADLSINNDFSNSVNLIF
jgi:hypothetical protein